MSTPAPYIFMQEEQSIGVCSAEVSPIYAVLHITPVCLLHQDSNLAPTLKWQLADIAPFKEALLCAVITMIYYPCRRQLVVE